MSQKLGPESPNWKNDKASYAAYHYRVQRSKGKPKYCEVCEKTDNKTWYEWANINGNYSDINDYVRMCRSCHSTFDRKIDSLKEYIPKIKDHCPRGHSYKDAYISSTGNRTCRPCKNMRDKIYKTRRLAKKTGEVVF